jgi:hypothetical protein
MYQALRLIRQGAGAAGVRRADFEALFLGLLAISRCLDFVMYSASKAKNSLHLLHSLALSPGLGDGGVGSFKRLDLTCSSYISSLSISNKGKTVRTFWLVVLDVPSDVILYSLVGKNSCRLLLKDISRVTGFTCVEDTETHVLVRPILCDSPVSFRRGSKRRLTGSGGAGLGFSNQASALNSNTLSLSVMDKVSQFSSDFSTTGSCRDLLSSNRKGLLVFDGVRLSGLL